MPNPLARARYLTSVHQLRQLPPDAGREVAFAGRSNAGKSSALNALAGQGGLARVSKTPGRTQALNYFALGEGRCLVDLPGYGYAKVPEAMREAWGRVIDGYFRQRRSLVGLVVVMDVRHPLRDYDRQMLDYAAARGLPAHCLLTKADKLGRGEQAKVLAAVRRELGDAASAQLFSAETKLGVPEARDVLLRWLELEPAGDAAPVAPDSPR
ncbi:ribosome biogenesis GTP-binding protein YihA/YsxC [Arenimonas fontis]|uniref:Probable GTP-binding protein EngB n=1 Tax=Arenimonas fontis TaxID=2608255 RepID=A0A5B2Z805_9GAMM|nr:ribosome biogenesis GTP-binding protein YihA/YsxC [Arenimonas fontis]KAA2284005.1 YihA family ribosome biogenesis GTP-binding protein [Arenimonas fontis]